MGYQGKDSRWYNTIQEREAANQRWEQTQLLRKQEQLQREEAAKQDRFRREQERLLRDQLAEQRRYSEEQSRLEQERNEAIREQNRLLEDQALREAEERHKAYEARRAADKRAEIEEKVFPLLKEAGITDGDPPLKRKLPKKIFATIYIFLL